ncbi:MAG: class I SAM-dependent methyltransferase [Candidatus Heimdallarchaeota archaeon]|nr:class I SAM-dependent methyltransferase [Candidatus Heimdallarchaeota archaeon]
MSSEKNWLEVPAPDNWMTGWDNYHKKLLEAPDETFNDLMFITPPVQVIGTKLFGLEKGLRALELACGDGRYSCFLAKLGCKVDAIDALQSAVDVTIKRVKILGLSESVKVEKKNIDGWVIEPESYDIIVATQCLQYLFDRAIPRMKEIAKAIKPGGFFAYSGNIPPHFDTDPPMKFIYEEELREIFHGWTFHSLGKDERLIRPNDLRGYIWIVVEKPKIEKEEISSEKT